MLMCKVSFVLQTWRGTATPLHRARTAEYMTAVLSSSSKTPTPKALLQDVSSKTSKVN